MSVVTGGLLLGFSTSGTPPDTPSIIVNVDGTVATISGSTPGATNTVEVLNAISGIGSYDWNVEGVRVGNGTVALALDNGRYWAKVTSETSGGSSVSNLYMFRVGMPSGTLVHSPARIARQLFLTLDLGTEPAANDDWPMYYANEPNNPDEVITVYDTAGHERGRSQWDGERQEGHGIQVRVRADDHDTGYTRARMIAVSMDQDVYRETVAIDGETYFVHSISRKGDVIPLGKESPNSARRIFVVNAMLTMRSLS